MAPITLADNAMCQSNRPHILMVVANMLWCSDGFSLVLPPFSGEGEKQVFFAESKVYLLGFLLILLRLVFWETLFTILCRVVFFLHW